MITYDSNLKIFYSSKINDSRFMSGFATKDAGDARNTKNIVNFFSKDYDLVKNPIVILDQIHSANVSVFSKQDVQNIHIIEETDGVVSAQNQVILTVQTADCVPIIFIDRNSGIIGISHQGWRGSLKRLPQKMIAKMITIGATEQDITAAIGPSIGDCCYTIDDDRYLSFIEEFDGYSDKIFHMRMGKRYISLTSLNYLLLKESGLKDTNIDFFPFCTSCDSRRFFSFRRDKPKNYGEMLSFVVKL